MLHPHSLAYLAVIAGAVIGMIPDRALAQSQELDRWATDLRSADRSVRYRASIALSKLGPAADPVLAAALKDLNWETRISAAAAVRDAKRATPEIGAALAENLRYSADRELGYPPQEPSLYGGSPSLQVRWTAVAALGHIGTDALAAVPDLVAALQGKYEYGLTGPKPGDAYGARHWRAYEMRGAAAWVLQKLGPAAAEKYPETIPALAQALKDPQRMVRLNAAAALRVMGDATERAIPELLQSLTHEDQYTRIYAALAFAALGKKGAAYVPALSECHNSIHLDNLSRRHIREAIHAIAGSHRDLSDEVVTPTANPWPARRDFFLIVHPFEDSAVTLDPDKLLEAFLAARLGNVISYWPDHAWYNTPPPTADQLRYWDMGALWYFFTEDIFNPKLQRDWGFATVDDYNRSMAELFLESGRVLGKDRTFWSVGHEQMDNVSVWNVQPDGSKKDPEFATKRDGYEFYRQWNTTSLHKRHWMEYGNTRPGKFFDGWNPGAPATWEFIEGKKLDTSPLTMLSGGVSPVLAHATFDLRPQVGMYWWECQIDGASLQVGVAYTRGASRQYGRQWLLDASPWSPVLGAAGGGYLNGKWSGGVTDETQLRTWLYGYLSGARAVLEESSGGSHFRMDPYPNGPADKPVITSTGKTAQELARFCFEKCPDRGDSYASVALLLEHEHGFEPRPHTNFRGKGPWGYMPMDEGEYEIEQFWYAAFPGHSAPPEANPNPDDPRAKEPLLLTESAFGDCFDVLTNRAPQEVLAQYPRLMTLGGILIDAKLLAKLQQYTEAGGELVINAAHLTKEAEDTDFFGVNFGERTRDHTPEDNVEVQVRNVTPTAATVVVKSQTGQPLITKRIWEKGAVYLNTIRHNLSGPNINAESRWVSAVSAFLRGWIRPVWPIEVTTASGHAPQVCLNRLADGWLVTLGNHHAGDWRGTVTLEPGFAPAPLVTELWTDTAINGHNDNTRLQFETSVPEYSLRVYRIGRGA
ncbi:MAG: HEAT repeat domain-containing protein [Candidatus Hydrogenedentes bacterium]|nr:HEAT repeat domain-containing protein [Candidatus Hydrogenedentota bacterium]